MVTWDRGQIHQVSRLRVELQIDNAYFRTPEEGQAAIEFANIEMAKQLIEMGRPIAVEINPADTDTVWYRDDSKPWVVQGKMRWAPKTNIAELRGGHLDGIRYAIRQIGDPFKVQRPEIKPWKDKSDLESASEINVTTDIYELVGWREEERVWVYEATT